MDNHKTHIYLASPGCYLIYTPKERKIYIGSTKKSLFQRTWQHIKLLQKNKHHCKKLQESFNKYPDLNDWRIVSLFVVSEFDLNILNDFESTMICSFPLFSLYNGKADSPSEDFLKAIPWQWKEDWLVKMVFITRFLCKQRHNIFNKKECPLSQLYLPLQKGLPSCDGILYDKKASRQNPFNPFEEFYGHDLYKKSQDRGRTFLDSQNRNQEKFQTHLKEVKNIQKQKRLEATTQRQKETIDVDRVIDNSIGLDVLDTSRPKKETQAEATKSFWDLVRKSSRFEKG